MKLMMGLAVVLTGASTASAADIDAGKAKAAAVCAACHGAQGVSVSDAIPNLAGQKARYIELQLTALKDGTRKNPIMKGFAAQLSKQDIEDVAAWFSSQQMTSLHDRR